MSHIDCVGKGWHPIVQPLIDYCEKHSINITQVKEKLGWLRFYCTPLPEELFVMVREAERKSSITCEECGEPGEISGHPWLKCLCPKHHRKRKSPFYNKNIN